MSSNVRAVVSRGAPCAGWCSLQMPVGTRSIAVSFDVPVLFSSVKIDRELCVDCASRLRDQLTQEIRKIVAGR